MKNYTAVSAINSNWEGRTEDRMRMINESGKEIETFFFRITQREILSPNLNGPSFFYTSFLSNSLVVFLLSSYYKGIRRKKKSVFLSLLLKLLLLATNTTL